jgi:DNA-binding GntR family transcriptional regulator
VKRDFCLRGEARAAPSATARLNIDSLSRDLAVSSSPIREALVRLEAERLVVSELYSGYAVAPKPSATYFAALTE